MSEFLGSRISLISKSDIRYSGILHEINSEESTVSLENVKSFGTEGRKGNPEEEISPSDQVYEYIVFRGSDVKDLRIEQPAPSKENQPKVPDDPAIVGARARPAGALPPGPGASQAPGAPNFNPYQPTAFYPPPPPGQWGRGGPGPGPGPAQGFNGMPYPPPPGWFHPAQGFPPGGPPGGPGGPGPWNSFGYPPGPGPQGHPGVPGQGLRGAPQQDNKPAPIGAGADKRLVGVAPAVELPRDPKSHGQHPAQPAPAGTAPAPVESKASAAEVKATAESLPKNNGPQSTFSETKTGPIGSRSNRITPAVPTPAAILSKASSQTPTAPASVKPSTDNGNGPTSAGSLKDATQAAKAAVAVAMAKLNNARATEAPAPPTGGNAMDNLTKKVNEMRMNAAARPTSNGRGRGRGARGGGPGKVDVPSTDFDFEAGNAKFNKQDLVKEAIAGSPLTDPSNGSSSEHATADDPTVPPAYNKTKSFFDNISSEAKDRAENGGQKPGGREWRGEEQRKNIETFGQGSVDGGYRGGYRGRGRGRGAPRGRGFVPRGRGNIRAGPQSDNQHDPVA
ncbi:Scd6-like Sm domain-containing protein [Durotheca rogersii]|uniref:Scd6-like Sm domain-containing protein n=1 Tax=Durotheca rogersii TaxID=419775 RepID=UPI00221E6B9B|nr:Scd6-like Sm domain-containing protein [Durotheca rogersii]KAI5864341.1 Scd6-like Sm domain-containing protein [Durotheca rogersii]